ncbi:zinc metallochaperone AztD [Rhodococcus sp. NPDC060084]|uniref:zinc metallochaperone AztD n=1 Tax=Rhodococcus sp. NPDC060084 TaxID=3347053 RepID=UPI003665511D
MKTPSPRGIALTVALSAALAAGCSAPAPAPAQEPGSGPEQAPAEVSAAEPRLALTYDGGVLIVDETNLTVVDDVPLGGFTRLAPAGDGRHVMISTEGGFRALDTGSWSERHGDHRHHYSGPAALTETVFPAGKPGHVVAHGGTTALFDDATGRAELIDPSGLAATEGVTDSESYTAPHAHHGVVVALADGSLLVTLGDSDSRTGIALLDSSRRKIARTEECPGVHGEAVAEGETIAFGCQDGMMIYRNGTFTKATSPDDYGRIGNQAGSPASPVVLGDYKTDPDADLERPETVALVDTRTAEIRLVDLGTSYTFRSLGRGPDGEAVVLGTDGALHVLDPESGETIRRMDVLAQWTEPEDWQTPRPALSVSGRTAFVTDPATDSLHAVDLSSGDIRTGSLPHTPNEISGT